MEQHAIDFAREYAQNPAAWRMERIAPGSQGSCLGLPRQYAPPSDIEGHQYKQNQKHLRYDRVYYTSNGKWQGRYRHQYQNHYAPTCADPYDALVALDRQIRDEGLPRRFWVNWADYPRESEEQSA